MKTQFTQMDDSARQRTGGVQHIGKILALALARHLADEDDTHELDRRADPGEFGNPSEGENDEHTASDPGRFPSQLDDTPGLLTAFLVKS